MRTRSSTAAVSDAAAYVVARGFWPIAKESGILDGPRYSAMNATAGFHGELNVSIVILWSVKNVGKIQTIRKDLLDKDYRIEVSLIMKKTTRQTKETTFTVIYPDGQVVVMHNSSAMFTKVLDRGKADGTILVWMAGDHKNGIEHYRALLFPTTEKEGGRKDHPFRDLSAL